MLPNNLILEHVYIQVLKKKHYQQLSLVDQGQYIYYVQHIEF
jgi:hypothetical protein